MKLTLVYRFLSLNIWGNLPSNFQKWISKIYANIYNQPFTRFIIKPYCQLNYSDPSYLDQFCSETGNNDYSSFQDFFTRVYKELPKITSDHIWPCEGLLCDYDQVGSLTEINIKGDRRNIRTIFGVFGSEVPDHYFFSNVFLHNNNYHRIHCPVAGTVVNIEVVPGDLVVLRPWIYKYDPSLPALRNERVNIQIQDHQQRSWYLSIVGGPAVGTIELHERIQAGSRISIADELGKFLLGSTCCMAAPVPTDRPLGSQVFMGDKL